MVRGKTLDLEESPEKPHNEEAKGVAHKWSRDTIWYFWIHRGVSGRKKGT